MNAQHDFATPHSDAPPPLARLDAMFADQCHRTPDAIAIIRKGETVSYDTLDRRANRFANTLIRLGLKPGDRIAIALPRSIDLVAAVIGAMKARCVYIPIDLALPAERIAYMLEDGSAKAMMGLDPRVVPAEFRGAFIQGADLDAKDNAPKAGGSAYDPAYIFYTSGSTGKPKGVLLAHGASIYIADSIRYFTNGELNRVVAVTSISFDPSIFEIFAPLACGGTIVLKENALEPFSADERPTLLQGVPTALRQLARAGAIPETVMAINSGGETLTRDIADEIFARSTVRRIFNHYGPTEASICTTIASIRRESRDVPDVGTPIPGAEIHIRDMVSGQSVEQGQSGEIRIGGPVLALGYVGDPELTLARFVHDSESNSRVYRTGDLGRINADGRLEFLGRIDDQVKVRGHRVELAEVDDALAAMDGIADAGAVVLTMPGLDPRLIGFATARESVDSFDTPSESALIAALRQRLPASMVPHRIAWLPSIPRLSSGKVDRASLTRIAQTLTGSQSDRGEDGTTDLAGTIGSLFGDALNRAPLGQDEDFFTAGGDSLMCVDIALRLEELLDRPIAVNLLTHHSTPQALVTALSHQRNRDALITREGNEDGEPIFFAPGIRGGDIDYDSLKPLLAHRRLLMLHSLPIAEAMIQNPRMETLVATLAPLIEHEQPTGRITLLGYSFGGVMAYALAQELEKRGRDTRLAIIDAQISHCAASVHDWWDWLGDELIPAFRQHGLDHTMRRILRSVMFWYPRSWGRFRGEYIPSFLASENLEFVGGLVKAQINMRYSPRNAPTLLFVAEQMHPTDLLRCPDRRCGWNQLLTGEKITICHIPAMHSEVIRRPVVQRISGMLEDWLMDKPVSSAGYTPPV